MLLDYAQRMLTLRDESLRAVADQNVTPRGMLAIGANEATCLYVLPDVFAEYSRLYPAVQINIYRNFSRKIVETDRVRRARRRRGDAAGALSQPEDPLHLPRSPHGHGRPAPSPG